MEVFGLIIGCIGTLSLMSALREKNKQKRGYEDNTSIQNENKINDVVIPSIFVIIIGLFIGSFGLGFIVGGLLAVAIWNGLSEGHREKFGIIRAFVTSAFVNFVSRERSKQEKGIKNPSEKVNDGEQRSKDMQQRDKDNENIEGTREKLEAGEQISNRSQFIKHETSKVPTMDDFMRPILEHAVQCSGSFTIREITDAMADHFYLSAEARAELTGGGNVEKVYDRTNWAISHLKHAEFLRQVSRGRYEITDAGREVAKSSNEISVSWLMQNVPAYQCWKQSGTSVENHATKHKEPESKPATSEVPSMADFMRPILRWASEQSEEFTLREATDAMARHFNLSHKAKDELTGEGNVDRVYDRTSWSINPHLKEAGLVRSVRRGYWKITEAGKKEAFASNDRMTTGYLTDNFPSYRHWKENKKNNKD